MFRNDYLRSVLSKKNQQRVLALSGDLEGEDAAYFEQALRHGITHGLRSIFGVIFIARNINPHNRNRALRLLAEPSGDFVHLTEAIAKSVRMGEERIREVLNAVERFRRRDTPVDYNFIREIHLAS